MTSNNSTIFLYLYNLILGKTELICPSCASKFSVFKNHAGLQLGIPIYCCNECYLKKNNNPYET